MNQTQRMIVIAAVMVGGIGFTPKAAQDSTLGASTAGHSVEPAFRVSKLRNEVRLEGHTISVEQERQLITEAEFSFPGYAISSRFAPLGTVGPHWEDTTVRLLHVMTAADSGTAELDDNQLTLNVVASDDKSWAANLGSLISALPNDINIRDDSVSVAKADISALCRKAASGFSLGPINFVEATDELRPSAYPRLEQLAALADACRDSVVRLTGHSDSTGEEDWNKTLSLLRARAVASYLQSKGIAAERLESAGVGSAEPIASNENRYGRGLNRRIEIEFVSD